MTVPSTLARRGGVGAIAASLLLGAGLVTAQPALAAEPCATVAGAMQVTADCVDAGFTPVVDSESDQASPLPHLQVRGHFVDGAGNDTEIQFTIYLPPADAFEGRFFQYTYPTTFNPGEDLSYATDRAVGFAFASGGYAVQAGTEGVALGYRHAAAAAKFAETLAAQYYGTEAPIFGYLYGPSGGSYQTIGAAENTTDVWQGFVPMVQGVPQPTSYNFLGRAAAELILADKAEQIQAALEPGGSGDPYATLDEAESAMLTELHALGIPWQAWEYPDYLLGYTEFTGGGLDSSDALWYDPTYAADFWGTDGYLGTEDSPLGDRVRAELVEMGDTPANRWNIANRFYYRYQVPAAEEGWVGLDQFRSADGTPLYPQRSVSAFGFHGFVSGNTAFDGTINSKMIVVDNLYDTDALPWHADWYRKQVEASLGEAAADTYRIYYNDHADHQDAPVAGERAKHLVNWYGMVEQALRDVAAWAEDGVEPPASTRYDVEDAQIVVPDNAALRRGLQPTVDLAVDGQEIVHVSVGKPVKFTAHIDAAPNGDVVVATEWDFDGDGTYEAKRVPKKSSLEVKNTHRFLEPGTYLVALKVTTQRDGVVSPYAQVQNLDRVQVVVS